MRERGDPVRGAARRASASASSTTYIARRFPDLVRVLPERRATRAYWLVTHEDTRGLGRIRAAHEHLVACVERDRGIFG